MADISGLVKALKDKAVAQYDKGAPYRQALVSALRGDTQGINQALSKSDLTPMDFATTFAPLGMFIGKGSKVWNPNNEQLFMQLEKQGLSPEEIWSKTGTMRGVDNLLRQEISDEGIKFNTKNDLLQKGESLKLKNEELSNILNQSKAKNQKDLFQKELNTARLPLKNEIKSNNEFISSLQGINNPGARFDFNEIIQHPELSAAYPDVSNIGVYQGAYKSPTLMGSYESVIPETFTGGLTIYKPSLERRTAGIKEWNPESTSLHELQHAIQEKEGFVGGGSAPNEYKLLDDAQMNLFNQIQKLNNEMSLLAKNPTMSDMERNAYDMLMEQRQQLVPEYQKLQEIFSSGGAEREAFKNYKRLGGEAESRLTQRRMYLTPEERLSNFPYKFTGEEGYGLDVPFNELIYRK